MYFTCVPLDTTAGGGQLCCRNHVERLSEDPQIELRAVAAGPPEAQAATIAYFKSQSIVGEFIVFRSYPGQSGKWLSASVPWRARRWPYLNELEARAQFEVAETVRALVERYQPDCLVIDYLPSAYYLPGAFRFGVPIVIITLNREAEFYREMMLRRVSLYGRPTNRVAWLRLRCEETRIHWRSRLVVTIGKYDAPRQLCGRPRTCWIAPYMDPKPDKWRYTGEKSLFFVGNQGHFPNRDAIEWLATRFAPELMRLSPSIKIKIVGASHGDVPEAWHGTNIDYLGIANTSIVAEMFRTEAAFIAPIANDFGAKFKVVECIAYGTPLLAPSSAMSGVPFLEWLPRIALDQPLEAAHAARALVENREAQRILSARILKSAGEFIEQQAGIWGRKLRGAGIGAAP